jgi:hypothetical protein
MSYAFNGKVVALHLVKIHLNLMTFTSVDEFYADTSTAEILSRFGKPKHLVFFGGKYWLSGTGRYIRGRFFW